MVKVKLVKIEIFSRFYQSLAKIPLLLRRVRRKNNTGLAGN